MSLNNARVIARAISQSAPSPARSPKSRCNRKLASAVNAPLTRTIRRSTGRLAAIIEELISSRFKSQALRSNPPFVAECPRTGSIHLSFGVQVFACSGVEIHRDVHNCDSSTRRSALVKNRTRRCFALIYQRSANYRNFRVLRPRNA